jgi:hypothetical protein
MFDKCFFLQRLSKMPAICCSPGMWRILRVPFSTYWWKKWYYLMFKCFVWGCILGTFAISTLLLLSSKMVHFITGLMFALRILYVVASFANSNGYFWIVSVILSPYGLHVQDHMWSLHTPTKNQCKIILPGVECKLWVQIWSLRKKYAGNSIAGCLVSQFLRRQQRQKKSYSKRKQKMA